MARRSRSLGDSRVTDLPNPSVLGARDCNGHRPWLQTKVDQFPHRSLPYRASEHIRLGA